MYVCTLLLLRKFIISSDLFVYLKYPEKRQPFSDIFARLKTNIVEHGALIQPRHKTDVKEDREGKKINVLSYAEASTSSSCRKIEKDVAILKSDTQRVLEKYK